MAIFARIGTMKVYYYHTIDTVQVYADWQAGRFPGHFLYGATHLPKYGIDVVFHRPVRPRYRWMLTLHTAWRILTCRTRFDAIYATTFRGMEILIFLRALRLYRKPIFVWHHQPVRRAKNPLREFVARLFYRGMDHLFFFSDQLLTDSLRSSKAQQARMSVARWGADLDYYDRLTAQFGTADRRGFISTGRELRDMPTLVMAFNSAGQPLDIYICRHYLGDNYEQQFRAMRLEPNVKVHFVEGMVHREMSCLVNRAQCVVVCCHASDYTVGLTTVVEALALGLPLICTRNPQIPINIENAGCGIVVDVADTGGWERAVSYLATHPSVAQEMGKRSRQIAEQCLNLENCAEDVARILKREIRLPSISLP